jgi:hypothetical protein
MATLLLFYVLQNNFFLVAQQPYLGLGCLIVEVSRSRAVRHTALGMTPLDEGSVCPKDLNLTSLNTHKRKISMPPAGFEPTIPAFDRMATGIGFYKILPSQ